MRGQRDRLLLQRRLGLDEREGGLRAGLDDGAGLLTGLVRRLAGDRVLEPVGERTRRIVAARDEAHRQRAPLAIPAELIADADALDEGGHLAVEDEVANADLVERDRCRAQPVDLARVERLESRLRLERDDVAIVVVEPPRDRGNRRLEDAGRPWLCAARIEDVVTRRPARVGDGQRDRFDRQRFEVVRDRRK